MLAPEETRREIREKGTAIHNDRLLAMLLPDYLLASRILAAEGRASNAK